MKDKRLYLPSESVDFDHLTKGRQIERDVFFSNDPRDRGWIAENVPCQNSCPAITNVPGYIRAVFEERHGRAYELNRFVNIFPGVLGRICARPCEPVCRHGWEGNGDPVAICHLKRAAADLKPMGHRIAEEMFGSSGKTVAVIGAGPAGLGAAHDLAIFGHKVELIEALPEPGGMLRYGIPAFRLPRDVLGAEIDNVLRLGVTLRTDTLVGRDLTVAELLERFDAVLLSAGALKPNKIPIPGVDLPGVYTGLDFMMRINQGERIEVGKTVHVIGGGYTSMDCARTARRLGATRAIINILGSEDYMLVDKHELFEVKYERVEIRGLVSIQEIMGDGKVERIRYQRNRLGGFLPNGEREGVPLDGTDFEEDLDTLILAIGQQPAPGFVEVEVERGERDRLVVDPETFMTSREGLFCAGDFKGGASSVVNSIASGRLGARQVDRWLMGSIRKKPVVRFEKASVLRERDWDYIPRQDLPTILLAERFAGDGDAEVETGLTPAAATEEAKRCYLCYLKFEIDAKRCVYCRWCIDVMPKNCIKLAKEMEFNEDGSYASIVETEDWSEVAAVVIDNKECIRCGKCLEICPVKCIDVVKVELIEQPLTRAAQGRE